MLLLLSGYIADRPTHEIQKLFCRVAKLANNVLMTTLKRVKVKKVEHLL